MINVFLPGGICIVVLSKVLFSPGFSEKQNRLKMLITITAYSWDVSMSANNQMRAAN